MCGWIHGNFATLSSVVVSKCLQAFALCIRLTSQRIQSRKKLKLNVFRDIKHAVWFAIQ
jgi:hypothetical protein